MLFDMAHADIPEKMMTVVRDCVLNHITPIIWNACPSCPALHCTGREPRRDGARWNAKSSLLRMLLRRRIFSFSFILVLAMFLFVRHSSHGVFCLLSVVMVGVVVVTGVVQALYDFGVPFSGQIWHSGNLVQGRGKCMLHDPKQFTRNVAAINMEQVRSDEVMLRFHATPGFAHALTNHVTPGFAHVPSSHYVVSMRTLALAVHASR